MSMKIDRVKDDKISWSSMYGDPGTAQYHNLEDEVNYAVRHLSSHNISNLNLPRPPDSVSGVRRLGDTKHFAASASFLTWIVSH